MQDLLNFVVFVHRQKRLQTLEAVSFIQKQWKLQMKEKQQMKLKELDKFYEKNEVTRQQLEEDIVLMQAEINQQYHDKIYLRVLPQIVKIQNMYRGGVIKTKFRQQVRVYMKISGMFKHFSKYEVRCSFEKFVDRMQKMASLNDYRMKDRLTRRKKREEWM